MDGRFDALASCLLEGLGVREVGVADTLSALEASGSQRDLVVRLWTLAKFFAQRANITHHPYSRVSNHLGPQHADLKSQRGDRRFVQLRPEPFAASPHEMDQSADFKQEVSAFVDNAA